jgi:hypothetical protein
VYGFVIPMAVAEPTWPAQEGVNLRIDLHVDEPLCGDGRLMPNTVLLHTSPEARPRMQVLVESPLSLTLSTSPAANSTLVVTARVTSPFGAHDVGNVTVRGGGPSPVSLVPVASPDDYGGHFDGLRAHERSWTWHIGDASPGTYTFHATATNLQQTAEAKATETVPLGSTRDSPAGYVAALLAALAMAVVVVRRR